MLVMLKKRQTEQKRIYALECEAAVLKRNARDIDDKIRTLKENIKRAKQDIDAKYGQD